MGGEMKPGRGLWTWAQRHLNVTFAVGFILVLCTYLVVSRQLAVAAPGGKGILSCSPPFRSCTARPPSADHCFIRSPGRTCLCSSLR